jgi:hypothetical protein
VPRDPRDTDGVEGQVTTRISSIACAALVAGVALAEDSPPDAARRAEIAKSGRLAWVDREGRVSFSDLAGADPVVSDVAHVDWVAWLADGRRVAVLTGNRVRVIDAATGKSTDVTGEAKPGEQFTTSAPALSPDRRRLAVWRCDRDKSKKTAWGELAVVGVSVVDLNAGTRKDFSSTGPGQHAEDLRPRWSVSPPAWWSADGAALYVATGADTTSLVRCASDGSAGKSIASIAPGRWITQVAAAGESVAIAVEDHQSLEIRDAAGKSLLVLPTPSRSWRLAWSDDAKSLSADVSGPNRPIERWTITPGRPPSRAADFDDGVRVPAVDPKWTIVSRGQEDNMSVHLLWCKPLATGAAVEMGRGDDPRCVGSLVVFLRRRDKRGSDLWAFDPQDGASIQLTERPIDALSYDVAATPPASRGR